jgi:hypothetical protein
VAIYRENEIRRHFPEAWIDGYEELIPAMTNHLKDRYVLAAAARAGVKVIVTYNLKDFPSSSLAPYSITAQGRQPYSKIFTIWLCLAKIPSGRNEGLICVRRQCRKWFWQVGDDVR